MFDLFGDGKQFSYTSMKFSGGEIQVRLPERVSASQFVIRALLDSSDAIMELILLTDAIRRHAGEDASIRLECPYLPYARQDRVCASGESLAVRVMCGLINALMFDTVTVWDPHSDVGTALLDRVVVIPQWNFVARIHWKNTILVAPDAGAIKKTLESAKELRLKMVRADKVRSVVDGSITGTVVYCDQMTHDDFLIVDDICDGGRTFIELAKVLRPWTTGKIYLYVTHGIFSKGLDVFNGLIDGVYTANPFPSIDQRHPLLTVL